MAKRLRIRALGSVAAVTLLAAACGGGAAGSEEGGTVSGTVEDYAVTLDATSAPAGPVTFSIANEGPSEHEFLVVRSDVDPASLPVTAEGIVAEDTIDVVDEIPEWMAGETKSITLDLAAGAYILMCNIEGHYANGMHVGFTVE